MIALDARIPVLLIGICLSGIALVFLIWILTSGRLTAESDKTDKTDNEEPVGTDG